MTNYRTFTANETARLASIGALVALTVEMEADSDALAPEASLLTYACFVEPERTSRTLFTVFALADAQGFELNEINGRGELAPFGVLTDLARVGIVIGARTLHLLAS